MSIIYEYDGDEDCFIIDERWVADFDGNDQLEKDYLYYLKTPYGVGRESIKDVVEKHQWEIKWYCKHIYHFRDCNLFYFGNIVHKWYVSDYILRQRLYGNTTLTDEELLKLAHFSREYIQKLYVGHQVF